MKVIYIVIPFLLSFLNNSNNKSVSDLKSNMGLYPIPEQIMCSGDNFPRCTGSIYCSACKNCKYCKHCNSGGSCGVCGKRPNRSNNKQSMKKKKSHYQIDTTGKTYIVTQKTSLRTASNSKASIIKRLEKGEKVTVLE